MASKTLRLIPAVASLGAVLPACADPIVGEWEVTRFKGKVLPKSYTDDGVTYTKSASLIFEADGDMEIVFAKTITGAKTGRYAYSYLGDWTKASRGAYDITIEQDRLDCVISGGELECDALGERWIDAEKTD